MCEQSTLHVDELSLDTLMTNVNPVDAVHSSRTIRTGVSYQRSDPMYYWTVSRVLYRIFFAGGGGGREGGEMIELQLVNCNDILEVYKEKSRHIPL